MSATAAAEPATMPAIQAHADKPAEAVAAAGAAAGAAAEGPEAQARADAAATPAKRGRGRPRKHPLPSPTADAPAAATAPPVNAPADAAGEPAKRARGRPRKVPVTVAAEGAPDAAAAPQPPEAAPPPQPAAAAPPPALRRSGRTRTLSTRGVEALASQAAIEENEKEKEQPAPARPAAKRTRQQAKQDASDAEDDDEEDSEDNSDGEKVEEEPPVKRGRGRPRKNPIVPKGPPKRIRRKNTPAPLALVQKAMQFVLPFLDIGDIRNVALCWKGLTYIKAKAEDVIRAVHRTGARAFKPNETLDKWVARTKSLCADWTCNGGGAGYCAFCSSNEKCRSTVKEMTALTDAELDDIPCRAVRNPHYRSKSMYLYNPKAILVKVRQVYGSLTAWRLAVYRREIKRARAVARPQARRSGGGGGRRQAYYNDYGYSDDDSDDSLYYQEFGRHRGGQRYHANHGPVPTNAQHEAALKAIGAQQQQMTREQRTALVDSACQRLGVQVDRHGGIIAQYLMGGFAYPAEVAVALKRITNLLFNDGGHVLYSRYTEMVNSMIRKNIGERVAAGEALETLPLRDIVNAARDSYS